MKMSGTAGPFDMLEVRLAVQALQSSPRPTQNPPEHMFLELRTAEGQE
jgi:hypothetical protein